MAFSLQLLKPASARHVSVGDAARDRGDWPAAAAAYRAALKENPALSHIWIQLGHANKEMGSLSQATEAYREAAELKPADSDPYLHLGHVAKLSGDTETARRHYRHALALNPASADARAECRVIEEAEAAMAAPLRALIDKGDSARDRLDYLTALKAYRAVLEEDASLAAIWIQKGHAAKEIGFMDEARQAYRAAARLQPDDSDAYLHLGHLAKMTGDFATARAHYAHALDRDENNADAASELRWLDSRPKAKTILFPIGEIDRAVEVLHHPSRYAEMDDRVMELPPWFDRGLDPRSVAFEQQQMRLWREITRRKTYDAKVDEDSPDMAGLDAVKRPAFYANGDAAEAGTHLMAMGHILLRSKVRAGQRVMECGSGFGQNALAFARIGAKVDTVDIAPAFCDAVSALGAHYEVDLTSHNKPFGYNPAGEPGSYDLILFYESFHHCLDFRAVIPKLRDMLKPDGRIMMAGEPIVGYAEPLLPYPWGIRLDWENIAVMRHRGWMELGFQESFLMRQFAQAGMETAFYPDPNSRTAQVYEFRRWTEPMDLATCHMSWEDVVTWHPKQEDGRWTTGRSLVQIPARDGHIEVSMHNYHYIPRKGYVTLGDQTVPFELGVMEHANIRLRQPKDPDQRLAIVSNAIQCSDTDTRILGVCVDYIRPI